MYLPNYPEEDSDGNSILMLVCKKGLKNVAEMLLDKDESNYALDKANANGETAFSMAIDNEMYDTAVKMHKCGLKHDIIHNHFRKRVQGQEALKIHELVTMMRCGEVTIPLEVIERRDKCDSNPEHFLTMVDDDGNGLLMLICKHKLQTVALDFLDRLGKQYPNQPVPSLEYSNKHGDTLLMIAITAKLYDVALRLLEMPNCKPDQVDQTGDTALILASRTMELDLVTKMIERFEDKCGTRTSQHQGRNGANGGHQCHQPVCVHTCQDYCRKVASGVRPVKMAWKRLHWR